MKISAQELYDAVWKKPVRTLAKEWGLSDTGLAKVCRKNGIPLPPIGHWAKVAVGRGYPRSPYSGTPNIEIVFDGMASLKRPLLSDQAKQRLVTAGSAIPDPNSKNKSEVGTWAKRTDQALAKHPDQNGFLSAPKDVFRITISCSTRERAIRILSSLELALAAAGMEWVLDETHHRVVGKMFDETIVFDLTERFRRTEHVEKHAKFSWMDKKTYTYSFSGELVVRIEGWYEGRKSWADGKTKRLEEKFPEIIEGFLAAAEAMRKRTLEREEEHRRWVERESLRVERERIAREEKAFLEETTKEANAWLQANTIRQYAAEIRKKIADQKIEQTESGAQWLARVEQCAEKLDPVRGRLKL